MAVTAEDIFVKALIQIRGKDYALASFYLIECLKLDPSHVEAWIALGSIEQGQGRPFNALMLFERALSLDENRSDAWNNLGRAAADNGMWREAENALRRSIDLLPSFEPWMNLGNMYCHLMRLAEAEGAYREALKIDPGSFDAHTNLGITLMGMGEWKEGFREYEVRHRNSPFPPRAARLFPKWQGEPVNGKTIMLYPEQGFGDEILFLRYVAAVKELGARVVLEARGPMLQLARTTPADIVVPRNGKLPEGIDFALPTMDAPMVLAEDPHLAEHPRSYLAAPSLDAVQAWRKRLPTGFNVGLCWIPGQRPLQPETAGVAQSKSIPLAWLKPLFASGANFVSLQKVHTDDVLVREFGILDCMADIDDFGETAELIEALDLVISVDTAVAHLAAALGKETWNFVRFNGYWPWGTPAKPIPWYPAMRLYRQPGLANWDAPIRQAAKDLAERAHQNEKAAA